MLIAFYASTKYSTAGMDKLVRSRSLYHYR